MKKAADKPLDQLPITGIPRKRGGKQPGAGRPKGTTKVEPSKAIRVPLSLLPAIEKLIEEHKNKLVECEGDY